MAAGPRLAQSPDFPRAETRDLRCETGAQRLSCLLSRFRWLFALFIVLYMRGALNIRFELAAHIFEADGRAQCVDLEDHVFDGGGHSVAPAVFAARA